MRRLVKVSWPMHYFGPVRVPQPREEPDLSDPAQNDFIPDPDETVTPPEWATDGKHTPDDPYADPAKNDWIVVPG